MTLIDDIKYNRGIAIDKSFSYIGGGESAEIYSNSPDLVVKIPLKESFKSSRSIDRDFTFQDEIFKAGYPVPEPYGITSVRKKNGFQGNHLDLIRCFGMERINGHNLEEGRYLSLDVHSMRAEANSLVDSISRTLKLAPSKNYGLYDHNIMWDSENRRIVLIDFENWERT